MIPLRTPLPSEITDAGTLVPLFREVFRVLALPYPVRSEPDSISGGRRMCIKGCITLRVVNSLEFTLLCRKHGYSPTRPLLGLADFNTSSASIKQDLAPSVVAAAAHELGHLLKPRISPAEDEEAAAYAFEYACALAIDRYTLQGLGERVFDKALSLPSPLFPTHMKAHRFVTKSLMQGQDPLELYHDIYMGYAWVPTRRRTTFR